MFKKIIVCFLLCVPLYLLSDTIHDSSITSNETWTVAGNPHIVSASITIQNDVTVTIDPGCIVKINANLSISVNGTLLANGTSGNHITITRNGDSGLFSYIYFSSSSTGNAFSYCDFSYGNKALNMNSSSASISNCSFENCYRGIYSSSGIYSLSNSSFENNNYGAEIRNLTDPQIGSGCSFTNNGIGVKYLSCDNPTILSSCTFNGNENGIFFDQCSNPTINSGNQITNNTEYGIGYSICSDIGTIDNITVTGNTGYGAFSIKNSGSFTLGPDLVNSSNSWPLSINPGSFPTSDSNIPTTGNTNNHIQVIDGACDKTGTWYKFTDIDYYVNYSPTINSSGSLTIEPANHLYFGQSITINNSGTINAQGTITDSILFMGQDSRTTWQGFYIYSGGSAVFTYSKLSDANKAININDANGVTVSNCELFDNYYGIYSNNTAAFIISSNYFHNNNFGANIRSTTDFTLDTNNNFSNNGDGIFIYQCTNPTIDFNNIFTANSIGILFQQCNNPGFTTAILVNDNTTCGISYDNCADIGIIDSLTVTGNTGYGAFSIKNSGSFTLGPDLVNSSNSWPLSINPGSFPTSDSNIPTTGNTNNHIQVINGACDKTGTWYKFTDIDYYVNYSSTINSSGSLTIEPANHLYFGQSITINNSGTINAQGTITDSILFMGQDSRTTWQGFYIYSGGSAVFTYSKLSDANKAININDANGVTVSNCELFDNYYGIYSHDNNVLISSCSLRNNNDAIYCNNSSPDIIQNFIYNNVSNGIRLYQSSIPNLGSNVTEGNTIYGNGNYGIYNGTEDIDGNYIWWGTDNFHLIPDMIYDSNDNASLGTVNYTGWSDPDHTHTRTTATAPLNLTIDKTETQINLSWDSSVDGTYYQIYYSLDTSQEKDSWQLLETEIYSNSWSETNLLDKCFYYICAIEEL